MNTIILFESDKIADNRYKLSDFRKDHILNILKSDINDIIRVGLINDRIGEAVITDINEIFVELKITKLENIKEDKYILDVICALPRPQTLKKVLHTCSVMGVNHLYLIKSEKVEKSYFHSPLLNHENYNKFLIEGLSQGNRTKIPSVSIHQKFKRFFSEEINSTLATKLVAHPDSKNYLSSELLPSNNIVLAIGPEGGWNDFEINFMIQNGFSKYKLSNNILRVENAVTASLAQIELVINSQ